jgi:hypothetical protein
VYLLFEDELINSKLSLNESNWTLTSQQLFERAQERKEMDWNVFTCLPASKGSEVT